MLAGQTSIAVENAHNFEERKRRIVELNMLNQIGQALSSTLEKDDLIELIYHQVARVMDAQNFNIALYDAERDTISFPLAYEHGQCKVGQIQRQGRYAALGGGYGFQIATGRNRCAPSARRCRGRRPSSSRRSGPGSR